mgnify:CR=1 FL=1
MIVGVGIDTVRISELEEMCDDGGAFESYMFSEGERGYASHRSRPCESLAGMLAVKEAVTKAVCTLDPDRWIDMRLIEVEHDVHGAPHVSMKDPLAGYLEGVSVSSVLVSITNEGDFATAIALAQS